MRVAYLDLDGTLTLEGSMFHDAAGPSLAGAKALHRLLRAGYEIVPCSGRTVMQLAEIARLFASKTFIAELGSVVAYGGGRDRVPVSRTDHTAAGLRADGVADALFREFPGMEWHTPWSEKREYTLLLRGKADADEMSAFVAKHTPGLRVVDNGDIGGGLHAYHVLPEDVGKGHAIARDLEARNLSREDTVAFGDSPGDVEMAAHAGRYYWIGGHGEKALPENAQGTRARYCEGLLEAVEDLLGPDRG